MRNPFRSEADAFRLLLVTVGAFAAIAVASLLGGAWAGVPVWAVLTAAAAAFALSQRRAVRGLRSAPAHVGGELERRILVVAHGTAVDEGVVGEIERASAGYRTQVLVVCPTPVSQLDRWTSAVDDARAQARRHLDESVGRLREAGIDARGEIGDEDPLRAIEDALRTSGADEIVFATPRADAREAVGGGAVARARERFALPIVHVATAARP